MVKFFHKEKSPDGQRRVYIFGVCVLIYKRHFKGKANPPSLIEEARSLGVRIGERNRITTIPEHPRPIWGSEPYFIEIGDDNVLSFGITFLTHDASIRTSHRILPEGGLFPKFGRIKIGNECFIGAHVTIMPGVTIGNRCVVGACSVCTKDIPDGEVWAGNPARFICTSEQLAEKQYKNACTPEHKEMESFVASTRGGMAIMPNHLIFEQ